MGESILLIIAADGDSLVDIILGLRRGDGLDGLGWELGAGVLLVLLGVIFIFGCVLILVLLFLYVFIVLFTIFLISVCDDLAVLLRRSVGGRGSGLDFLLGRGFV